MRRNRTSRDFNWSIMYDPDIGYDPAVFSEIEKIYIDFDKYCRDQLLFEKQCKNWDIYHSEIEDVITKQEAKNYETDWQSIYNIYRNRCLMICPDVRELANICVLLCYKFHPSKTKKFLWNIAGAGIVENIKKVPIALPCKDANGKYEYLGQRYSIANPEIIE